jgi:hypothetical protein
MGSFINKSESILAVGATEYGQAIDCTQKLLVSAQMKIANPDTNTGSITIMVSNKDDPILTSDADWVASTETTTTMTNALNVLLELTDFPNKWARIKLVDTEGGNGMTLDTHYSVKGF